MVELSFFNVVKSVLGDKLVKNYLLESDLYEEPLLPSPNQLKYKILIKNKKIQKQNPAQADGNPSGAVGKPTTPAPIVKHRVASKSHRMNDLVQSKCDFDDMDNDNYAGWPSPLTEQNKQPEKQSSNKAVNKKRKMFMKNFHKSQSLTDSAFHGLNLIFTNNKKPSNNLAVNFNGINSLSKM